MKRKSLNAVFLNIFCRAARVRIDRLFCSLRLSVYIFTFDTYDLNSREAGGQGVSSAICGIWDMTPENI